MVGGSLSVAFWTFVSLQVEAVVALLDIRALDSSTIPQTNRATPLYFTAHHAHYLVPDPLVALFKSPPIDRPL